MMHLYRARTTCQALPAADFFQMVSSRVEKESPAQVKELFQ